MSLDDSPLEPIQALAAQPGYGWLQGFTTGPMREVPVYNEITHDEFLTAHLEPNLPLLLSASHTASWPSRRHWAVPIPNTHEPGPSRPNLSALRQFAHHVVPVADTRQREFSEFAREERPLGDVLDEWQGARVSGDTEGRTDSAEIGPRGRGAGAGLYVKDWHLLHELESAGRGAGEVYVVPECLRDDWLNPAYTSQPRHPLPSPILLPSGSANHPPPSTNLDHPAPTDFRFTYLGPRGTFTPLHRDVYASYSWSANVVGRKAWWLFPPSCMPELSRRWAAVKAAWWAERATKKGRSDGGGGGSGGSGSGAEEGETGELPFDVRSLDLEGIDVLRIVQEEGEIIFVPSGWYHQVVNLDFCISINHNFFSSTALPRISAALRAAQERVEESLADVREMIRERLGVAPVPPVPPKMAMATSTTTLSGLARASARSEAAACTPARLHHDNDHDIDHANHVAQNGEEDHVDENDTDDATACGRVDEWEREWTDEVQKVLELDAGWGWRGFWRCVEENLRTPPAPPHLSPPPKQVAQSVRDVIRTYKTSREWVVLRETRVVVRRIEALLQRPCAV